MRYLDLNNLAPPPQPPIRRSANPSGSRVSIFKKVVLVIVIFIFFAVGYWSFFAYQAAAFILSSTNQTVANILSPSQSPGSSGQENYLLLGSDNDQKFTGNPLTQTMMVVHIDHSTNQVTMFSIPRDLWVKMPGSSHFGKIDEASGYGGIPNAIKVVQQTFGIQIQHYAWVGLYGFVKGVDDVGGVNLDVLHPVLDNSYPSDISDPNNPYGYLRLDIPAGLQHMNGETALEYVRSRHEDLLGDFGRSQRQRQLLITLKDEILSPTLLSQAPTVLSDIQDQVKTDMTPFDLVTLGQYFLNNKSITINQLSLSPPYTKGGVSTSGQSIVIANPVTTSQLVGQIFGSSAEQTTLSSLSNPGGVQP